MDLRKQWAEHEALEAKFQDKLEELQAELGMSDEDRRELDELHDLASKSLTQYWINLMRDQSWHRRVAFAIRRWWIVGK